MIEINKQLKKLGGSSFCENEIERLQEIIDRKIKVHADCFAENKALLTKLEEKEREVRMNSFLTAAVETLLKITEIDNDELKAENERLIEILAIGEKATNESSGTYISEFREALASLQKEKEDE